MQKHNIENQLYSNKIKMKLHRKKKKKENGHEKCCRPVAVLHNNVKSCADGYTHILEVPGICE